MTSAQTMSSHASFSTKPKSLRLSDKNSHNFTSTETITEHETLAKNAPSQSPSNSRVTRMSLRAREPSESVSVKSGVQQSRESIKKNDSPPALSDGLAEMKNSLLSNKATSKWEKTSEGVSNDKPNDLPRSRKVSEDITGYNTRKQVKTTGYLVEPEESKSKSRAKKSAIDTMTDKKDTGYHLRRIGNKNSQRDTNFDDFYEYDYPTRNPTNGDASGGHSSNNRSRNNKNGLTGNNDDMDKNLKETPTSRGTRGQKGSASRGSKQDNSYKVVFTEDMSGPDVQADMYGKRKHNDKSGLASRDLSCTEDNEDLKNNLHPGEVSESGESSTRSPSTSKDGMRAKRIKCLNKLCTTDPNTPSLWAREKVKGKAICKVCWDAYQKEQYCYFCAQIYLDDEDSTTPADDKDWIGCDTCGCWNHIQCEAAQGLRNLVTLLRRDKSYKYFCPQCRNKDSKKGLMNTQDSTARGNLSPSYEPSQSLKRRPQSGRTRHLRPPVDDWLAYEEGLEEPFLTKVRINGERAAEISQNEEEDDKFDEGDELKRKLDSLFNRTSLRRRHLHQRPTFNILECFSEIDKLMNQYGGKKMQLNEHEIRADLMQIKELTKMNESVQGHSEISVSEMEVLETAEEEMDDFDTVSVEKAPGKSKNQRTKQQRKNNKGREPARNQRVQTILKEERNLIGNGKEKEGAPARMSLRARKAH